MRWMITAAVVLALIQWARRRVLAARDAPDPALEIKPPTYRYLDHDEDLAHRTNMRREAAARIRQRAARVESGESVYRVMRGEKSA